MVRHEPRDPPDDGGHLRPGGAGELDRLRQEIGQFIGRQTQPRVGSQAFDQFLPAATGLATHTQRDLHGMSLDHLVRSFPPHPGSNCGHQHLGGGQERQIAIQFPFDHPREGAEFVEHREERLQHPVEREERVGQCDSPHHAA